MKIVIVFVFLLLSACTFFKSSDKKVQDQKSTYFKKVSYSKVEGWGKDKNISEFVGAFATSCRSIQNRPRSFVVTNYPVLTTAADWAEVCSDFINNKVAIDKTKNYLEKNFDVYLVGDVGGGLVTGYYHIFLKGSRERKGKFVHPIYELPEDMLELSLKDFNINASNNVTKIVGRVNNKRFVPYYSASEIEKGVINHKAKVIAYTDNAVERFLLHVQGSGTLFLNDGTRIKLDYAGKNGLPFRGIQKQLVDKGLVASNEVAALENIIAAYNKHPNEVENIILNNKSYVFFKESDKIEVIGGMGIPLTPKRSLAVDLAYIGYGVPIWLQMDSPTEELSNRMMVAQDTGGAILGPNRLDFYYGEGNKAGQLASVTKNKASVYVLIPKTSKKT